MNQLKKNNVNKNWRISTVKSKILLMKNPIFLIKGNKIMIINLFEMNLMMNTHHSVLIP